MTGPTLPPLAAAKSPFSGRMPAQARVKRCAAPRGVVVVRFSGLRVRAHRVRGNTDGTVNPIRSKTK